MSTTPVLTAEHALHHAAAYATRHTKNGISEFVQQQKVSGNDKVYMIATPVSYSSNEHHSAEQRRWKNNNVAGLQIVFADSSTARMAVDGYYFSTLFARPPCETPSFLNECLRNSPLKLVQCGAIHHAERCRRGTAVSSSVSHMGLPGRCGAPDLVAERSAADHVAPPLLFYSD